MSNAPSIVSIKIHPAIGVARLGNSDEFFIGPERPLDRPDPTGGFKDAQHRIKRQAARFRLFAYYDDGSTKEITAAEAEITWTVHLANRKAISRNPDASSEAMTIDPGPRTISGPDQQQIFNTGQIAFPGLNPVAVPLGEIRTESDGRLLVLSSTGNSASPYSPPKRLSNYLDNPGWYDNSADGPVSAHIKLNTGEEIDAAGAWVIVTPPKYAPQIDNVITLHDRIFEMGAENNWHAGPARPSYTQDIYPILSSAGNTRWVQRNASGSHRWQEPVYAQNLREWIFSRLATPDRADTDTEAPALNGNMPLLAGNARLTATQYEVMRKWKDDQFDRDWNGPPQVPTTVTPQGIDRAALENCVGAAFYPGIEAGGIVKQPIVDPDNYLGPSDPMRLDHGKVVPGGITEFMALPWQADFRDCAMSWWPVPRPNQVIPEGQENYVEWDRGIGNYRSMVENWTKLGFIVKQGDRYVETERDL